MNELPVKNARPTLSELDRTCQKLEHKRLGNWMARHVARPLALRVTWIVAPWGITAHAATLAAWGCGLAAAIAFACGSPFGWVTGGLLLQAWYLLDHVDGQLARWHRTESLDGVALDYLMHHCLALVVPCGVGAGLFVATLNPLWALAGLAWGTATCLAGLANDVRYKAMFQRLKRVDGRLTTLGGGGGRPAPAPPVPRSLRQFVGWLARKSIEGHVVMNTLTLLALAVWRTGRGDFWGVRLYVALATMAATAVAARVLWSMTHRDDAEREFAAWFRIEPGHSLTYRHGWWMVEPVQPPLASGVEPPRSGSPQRS
ncbi:MAG: CDP-alcohol phosphatidyltransferase family protein [Pirellulales bacterium]|nr:CDP-alcohol phosphatidyltransferase family protein [Pirellulales bacterium]